jgi:hypothetical protein
MTKRKSVFLSIASIIFGYISLWLSFGILSGPTLSSIGLLLGIVLIIFGIVMFIVIANKN